MQKGILIILDGYGEGKDYPYNAVKNANTPFLDKLHQMSHSLLKTDGEAVGQFKNELGGSEVGHTTIGAGKITPSTAKKIHDDIKSGEFKNNLLLLKQLTTLKKRGGNLHLVGMMSDKNIHSDIHHAYEIIKIAKSYAKNIFLHLITDGRDTPPKDSLKYLREVQNFIKPIKNCEIASIGGRLYAMDREGNLDRTILAYNAMFNPKTKIKQTELNKYLSTQHKLGNTDQYIIPTGVETSVNTTITKNDTIFIFNFREDRLRQLAREMQELPAKLITMSRVEGAKSIVLYPVKPIKNTMIEHLSKLGLSQLKISETTKYAHVTYYLNGGREEPFPGEERVHVKTRKVENFATTPKMRAGEIATEAVKAIEKGYDAIYINFSNPDMVGHTGDYEATVTSLEFLDKCVKKVVDNAIKNNYVLLITADHGNSEEMRTENGEPHMAHTLNRVFCVAVSKNTYKMARFGGLQDIAPTFEYLLGVKKNPHYTGKNLILNKN